MNQVKEIIIDLREEFELLELKMVSQDPSVLIINIPSRSIFANKSWISRLSKDHKIYLVCKKGIRATNIKNTYFKNNKNIVIGGGVKAELKLPKNKVQLVNGPGGLGMQQYVQLVFVCILLLLLVLHYFNADKKYIMGLLVLFILFIGAQVITKGCLISSIVPLSLGCPPAIWG